MFRLGFCPRAHCLKDLQEARTALDHTMLRDILIMGLYPEVSTSHMLLKSLEIHFQFLFLIFFGI